jgi:hypothetical protein
LSSPEEEEDDIALETSYDHAFIFVGASKQGGGKKGKTGEADVLSKGPPLSGTSSMP